MTNKLICQSCGMPLTADNMGTNADDSQNNEYCCFCFEKGEFTDPNLTLKNQTKKLIDMAILKMNMSKENATMLAHSTLPNLKRWKKDYQKNFN